MPVTINGTSGVTTPSIDAAAGNADLTTLSVAGNEISAVNSLGFRNRIINGDMRIDQRNAGASVTATALANLTYVVDRWGYLVSVASKMSLQQNAGSVTPPAGFINYLGVTSLSAYTVGASETFAIEQNIEGLNVADLGWGTANAQSVTLSFWVRSSLTGTFSVVLKNSAANRSYPVAYTINSANTWEQKTITIAGDTSGTWLTTNGIGIRLYVSVGSGSSLNGTSGAWAGSDLYAATGQTSVVGTNGATFYITGVQLEAGSVASPFERRDYGRELIMCQRYFAKTYNQTSTPGSTASGGAGAIFTANFVTNTYPNIGTWKFPVAMRATPTMTGYNPSTGSTTTFQGDSAAYSPYTFHAVGEQSVTAAGSNVSVGTSVYMSLHATASAEL